MSFSLKNRPRSAAATSRKVANHPGSAVGRSEPPSVEGVMSGPGEVRDFSPGSAYTTQDDSYLLGALSTRDFSKVNAERHNWERVDTFQTPWGHQRSNHSGWVGHPRENGPEVLDVAVHASRAPVAERPPSPDTPRRRGWKRIKSPDRPDVVIGPGLHQDFTTAVAEFTLVVNEMKEMKSSFSHELSTGVSTIRDAVAHALREILDTVSETKTPNDLLPGIKAELVRIHRDMFIGFQTNFVHEFQKANSDSLGEIREIKNEIKNFITQEEERGKRKKVEKDVETPITQITVEGTTMAQITQQIDRMKDSILQQGFRTSTNVENQLTALKDWMADQNKNSLENYKSLEDAIAGIDTYYVDLSLKELKVDVLEELRTLSNSLGELQRNDASQDVYPQLLEAISNIDRTPIDLNPVLEASEKLRKEAARSQEEVLAALSQLDHTDTFAIQVTDALTSMQLRSALDFKPVLETMGNLESQINKIHGSTDLVSPLITDLKHDLVPMIGEVQRMWKSDLVTITKDIGNVRGVIDNDMASLRASISDLREKNDMLTSTVNTGLRTVQKQISSFEEAKGEQSKQELDAIKEQHAKVLQDHIHEMQDAILATLEKQEMSLQNRLPVAELSVCQYPFTGNFTANWTPTGR